MSSAFTDLLQYTNPDLIYVECKVYLVLIGEEAQINICYCYCGYY